VSGPAAELLLQVFLDLLAGLLGATLYFVNLSFCLKPTITDNLARDSLPTLDGAERIPM
jgi:hypothetical protein